MNSLWAIAELEELKDHIEILTTQLANGDYDLEGNLSYQVILSHLMEHINRAWHLSKLTNREIDDLSQEAFERITNSIPKLDYNFKLVRPDKKVA